MLLPQLPQLNKKKTATQHVGDILRAAADQAAQQEQLAPRGVPALASQLPNVLQPGTLPEAPTYPPAPPLQFPRTYEPDPLLGRLFNGPPDGINPLDLQYRAMLQRGQMPSQADFNLANVQGQTAEAKGTLGALYPNGFQETPNAPLSLPPLAPRDVPRFPGRPAPQSDTMGTLLGALAGFIDPVGAGTYNADPLKAAADVANKQYDDRLRQFENAVLNAANAYNDARNERGAQFDAAVQNQQQGNLLRNFDQARREKYAGLVGQTAGGEAYGGALGPLAQRGQTATQGNALESFLGDYLDRAQRDSQLQNEASQHNWRNAFDLTNTDFENKLKLSTEQERMRNNSLDLLGSLLRPQFDPLLGLRSGLLNSQIDLNKARQQELLTGGGKGPDGLTDYQRISLALRMGAMGVDPTGVPGVAQIPGMSAVVQQNYQQKATALQMRDPRIRTAESDLRGRVIQRDALFRDYQTKLAQGLLNDAPLRQSYIDSITRADREIQTATRARDEALKALPEIPRTPGVSTGVPTKTNTNSQNAPRVPQAQPTQQGKGSSFTPQKPAAKKTDYSKMSDAELKKALARKLLSQ